MTVNKLSNNRVLIVLCEQDIEEINGIDFDDGASRSRVIGLTRRACRSSGIETGGKRVNIEALPLEKTCYLLVTVDSRKRYRIKKSGSGLCCKIEDSTAFLSAIEQLYRLNIRCGKNSAYKKGGAYFLVFDYPSVPKRLRLVLSEFGQWQSGKFRAERVKEFAEPICERNAVETIGKELV